MRSDEMPVGFAMALAMNTDAMKKFSALSEEQKRSVIEGTHLIKSSSEMKTYVSDFASDKR